MLRHVLSGKYYLYCMSGFTAVSEGPVPMNPNLDWQVNGIADFDGDDKADILLRHRTNGNYYMYCLNENRYCRPGFRGRQSEPDLDGRSGGGF